MAKRTFDKIATDILNGHMIRMSSQMKAVIQDVVDILFEKRVLCLEKSLEANFAAFQRFLGPEVMAAFAMWLQMEVARESAKYPSPLGRKRT